jgi:hypothetical protein
MMQKRKTLPSLRGYRDWKFLIELLEEYPCSGIAELRKRVEYYIKQFDSHNNGYNTLVIPKCVNEIVKARYHDDPDYRARVLKRNYANKVQHFTED